MLVIESLEISFELAILVIVWFVYMVVMVVGIGQQLGWELLLVLVAIALELTTQIANLQLSAFKHFHLFKQ